MMDFYNCTTHTARKVHKCDMCGQEIKPGEKYSYTAGKYYGDFFTRYMHLECEAVLSEYCSEVDNEFSWDDISEYWQDRYCRECENRYPVCKPDSLCKHAPKSCPDMRNGRCTADEYCDLMDRVCWCTKFKKEKSENE